MINQPTIELINHRTILKILLDFFSERKLNNRHAHNTSRSKKYVTLRKGFENLSAKAVDKILQNQFGVTYSYIFYVRIGLK